MANFCRDWSYRLSFNADIVWIRHFEQKLSSEADLLRRYFPMLKYRKADFLPHDPPCEVDLCRYRSNRLSLNAGMVWNRHFEKQFLRNLTLVTSCSHVKV